jgi:hypothetical protein
MSKNSQTGAEDFKSGQKDGNTSTSASNNATSWTQKIGRELASILSGADRNLCRYSGLLSSEHAVVFVSTRTASQAEWVSWMIDSAIQEKKLKKAFLATAGNFGSHRVCYDGLPTDGVEIGSYKPSGLGLNAVFKETLDFSVDRVLGRFWEGAAPFISDFSGRLVAGLEKKQSSVFSGNKLMFGPHWSFYEKDGKIKKPLTNQYVGSFLLSDGARNCDARFRHLLSDQHESWDEVLEVHSEWCSSDDSVKGYHFGPVYVHLFRPLNSTKTAAELWPFVPDSLRNLFSLVPGSVPSKSK